MSPKTTVSGGSKAEAQVGATTGQQAVQQPENEKETPFAALLAAAMPQAQLSTAKAPARTAQITLPGGAVTREAALAGLAADSKALAESLSAEPGTLDPSDVVASFVELLQQFDAATGGNAMELLAQNLDGRDASGLAQLDAAAADPASLIAALASLVGVSVTENAGTEVKLSLHPQKTWPQGETARAAPVTPLKGRDGEAELPWQANATSLMPVDAKPTQQQPAVPGDPRVDMRSAVMTALASVGPGAEGEPVPMQSALAEARPIATSTPDIARTAETWQPSASGFARNLAQQIRSATFTDRQTRIALAPRGLGEIEIDMQPDEAGKLRIVLRAENPAVLQALRGDRDGLLLALTESGADVRDADLGFEDFSRRQGRQSDAAEAPLGGTADLGIEEPPAIAVLSPRIDGNGSLDMLT